MIQLTNIGLAASRNAEDLKILSAKFHAQQFLVLPSLVNQNLLRTVSLRLERSRFQSRIYDGVGKDLSPDDDLTTGLLSFLCNDRQFLDVIEAITRCGHLGCFIGRVYRMMPAAGHFDSWHNDLLDDRKVALSINLTHEPYAGGVLEIRESGSKRIVSRVSNTGYGDGVVFPIAEGLEHRRTAVEGNIAKTAFAGWFKSKPEFLGLMKETEENRSKD